MVMRNILADGTLTTIVPQLTRGKILDSYPHKIYVFICLFYLIFNHRFIVAGTKYPGWRYAYNPCTPVNVGQNDPDADPHKLCRDVAVSFSRDFQILCPIVHSFPFLILLQRLLYVVVGCRSSHFLFFIVLVLFFALLLLVPLTSVLLQILPLWPIFITFVKNLSCCESPFLSLLLRFQECVKGDKGLIPNVIQVKLFLDPFRLQKSRTVQAPNSQFITNWPMYLCFCPIDIYIF